MAGLNKKRLWISISCGAVLGIFCIIGVGLRLGVKGNEIFLIANWYNRVIMGLIIGLAGGITITKNQLNPPVRGLLIGIITSLALLLSSGLRDPTGFSAGIAYGIIIDYISTKHSQKKIIIAPPGLCRKSPNPGYKQ